MGWVETRVGKKHFFDLLRKRKLLRKVSQFSRNFVNFSRKKSDEKWYKISVEKEYMEPDPCFFGLLDPDPYIISTHPDSDPVPDPGLI
jgi:hypothetical protein